MSCSDLAVHTKLFALVENDGLIMENKELIFSYCHFFFFLVLCTTYAFNVGSVFSSSVCYGGGLGECMFVYMCKCTHTCACIHGNKVDTGWVPQVFYKLDLVSLALFHF